MAEEHSEIKHEDKVEHKESHQEHEEIEHRHYSGHSGTIVTVILVIMTVMVAYSLFQINSLNNKMKLLGAVTGAGGKPEIDFYVMSYCPYGNIAEEAIEPVFQLLGDKAEFNPHYVVYSNYRGGGPDFCIDENSLYCSMHGVQEMNQDIRELCVNKHLGIKDYFRFVLAMNQQCTSQNADTCWEGVAKQLGLDIDKIKKCQEEEALQIAAEELALNQQLGVSGSPTIFVNGKSYNGQRTPAGYLQALCNEFTVKPAACSQQLASETQTASGSC